MNVLVAAEIKLILGAAILGMGGDEVVHALLDVMYADAPYTVVEEAMHIHPTVAEYLPVLMGRLEPLESRREWGWDRRPAGVAAGRRKPGSAAGARGRSLRGGRGRGAALRGHGRQLHRLLMAGAIGARRRGEGE
jgi:hypothetical protein